MEHVPIFDFENTSSLTLRHCLLTEKRLEKNPTFCQYYADLIREYLNNDYTVSGQIRSLYLQHHYVLKPDNTTTSLRIAGDALTKTNDCS